MPDNLLRQVILWPLTIQLTEPLSYLSLLNERFPNLYDFLSFFSLWLVFQLPSKTKLFYIHIVMLYLDFSNLVKNNAFSIGKKRVVSWIRTSSVLAGFFRKYFTTWKRSKNYLIEMSSINLLSRRIPSFYQQTSVLFDFLGSSLRPSAHWVHTTWIDKVMNRQGHESTDPSLAHRGIHVTSQIESMRFVRHSCRFMSCGLSVHAA